MTFQGDWVITKIDASSQQPKIRRNFAPKKRGDGAPKVRAARPGQRRGDGFIREQERSRVGRVRRLTLAFFGTKTANMSDPHGQTDYDTRFEWGLQGLAAAGAGIDVVVIVDVLSFSTAVEVCVARGGAVHPFAWKDERAEAFATAKGAILAVSRNEMSARRPFSLSPTSLMAIPSGVAVVLPSPNGATLSVAAATIPGVTHVLAGSLRNASAIARAAALLGRKILVVAAGERWRDDSLRPALEDQLGAAAILAALPRTAMSPEAEAAASGWCGHQDARRMIMACASGRELLAAGYEHDVRMATEYDVSVAVPSMQDGAYRRSS